MNVRLSKLTYAGLCGSSSSPPLRRNAARSIPATLSIAKRCLHADQRGFNTLSPLGLSGLESLGSRSRPSLSYFSTRFPDPVSVSSPSSILQFVASKASFATHRSGSPLYRNSGGYGYPPPKGPFRRVFDSMPGSIVIWGILGINAAVFLVWNFAASNIKMGNPSIYITMRRHFLQSAQNLREGRYWTLLTSCFSHQDTFHFLFNSIALYTIAPTVLAALGNARFVGFYLASGVISNLFSHYWHSYARPDPNYSSHGASGAVSAAMAFSTCLEPTATFLLFGIVPMPAWFLVGGLLAYDGYNTWFDVKNGVNAAAHIGGLAAGFAYFFRKRFGM